MWVLHATRSLPAAVTTILAVLAVSCSSPSGPEGPRTPERHGVRPALDPDCDTAEDLRAAIDALEADGTFNHGRATALRSKVAQAERAEDRGDSDEAAEAYARLIEQIEGWIADGTLSEEDLGDLLACAEDVVDGPDAEFAAVSAGALHTCGLTSEGVAYCWGDSQFGQLGHGSHNDSSMPVLVAGGYSFTRINAGSTHTCGLTATGDAYCWGRNLEGRLGNGTSSLTEVALSPVLVLGGHDWVDISAGGAHTCGVTSTGDAYCWGSNFRGELGNGTTSDSDTPVLVLGGLGFADITAGSNHTCGLTTAGVAHCWGENLFGALGNGTNTDSHVPVGVSGGLAFGEISAGEHSMCGRTAAGAGYCWGGNSFGQLGDGTNMDRNTPVSVAGGFTFASIQAGESHSCGVTTGQVAHCWGHNESSGKLGDGTNTSSNSPVAVAGGLEVVQISPGVSHTCAITTAGEAYCWGRNDEGQLGDGTNTHSNVPVPVEQV